MDFVKVKPQKHARILGKEQDRSGSRYWRSFKSPIFLKSYAAINDIHFTPSTPHRYCITSGTRLQIYSPKTHRVVKTIARFPVPALTAEFRYDGKLVAAGDQGGGVQVFDVNSRAVLRTLKGHAQPVHVTKFSPPSGGGDGGAGENSSQAGSTLLTASDDTTVRLWDLSTSAPISTFTSHTDYVRTATFLPKSPSLILSADYSGVVRLWDSRVSEGSGEVWKGDHGWPVEDLTVHQGGTVAVSAGGPVVRVWDLLGGSRQAPHSSLLALSNHQKTITKVLFTPRSHRLLSASLDGQIKVYNSTSGSYNVLHTMRYGAPLLSVGISANEGVLVVGDAEGGICIRKRKVPKDEEKKIESVEWEAKIAGSGMEASEQVMSVKESKAEDAMAKIGGELAHGLDDAEGDGSGDDDDEDEPMDGNLEKMGGKVVTIKKAKRRRKLQPWDKHLKSFRYSDALDSALVSTVPPNTTFSLIRELVHRNGIAQAIAGRDDVSLAPLLSFLSRFVADPRFSRLACDTVGLIIDIYEPVLGKSPMIDDLFATLSKRVAEELKIQRDLFGVRGMVEMVMAGATGAES